MKLFLKHRGQHVLTLRLFAVLVLFILAGITYSTHTQSLQYRYAYLKPSVVKVNNLQYSINIAKNKNAKKILEYVSLGTGTFVDRHYILTASHVLTKADALNIEVEGVIYSATVVWDSPMRDYAILYVPDHAGVVAKLGDSAVLEVGDAILTLGNPRGLLYTLGYGFVSAPPIDIVGDATHYIQSWTQVNPGNSGGALFNTANEIVGVVILHADDYFDFSIPINDIKDTVVREIEKHKKTLDNV